MWGWVRKIPHPSYGNYGGAYNKCKGDNCPLPIDWMDSAFAQHDIDLEKKDPLADYKLAVILRTENPNVLMGYRPIRYWLSCLFLFKSNLKPNPKTNPTIKPTPTLVM